MRRRTGDNGKSRNRRNRAYCSDYGSPRIDRPQLSAKRSNQSFNLGPPGFDIVRRKAERGDIAKQIDLDHEDGSCDPGKQYAPHAFISARRFSSRFPRR